MIIRKTLMFKLPNSQIREYDSLRDKNMNRNIETIVYRDDRYPSSWISDRDGYPDRIAQYLRSKGLEVMNADELRKFMIDSIEKGNAHESWLFSLKM